MIVDDPLDLKLDPTDLTVVPEVYAEIVARLREPPGPNVRLRKTLTTAAPWENECTSLR